MYLVGGEPATGKALLGMHFLEAELEDDSVLFIRGEEPREEILALANGAAIDIDIADGEFLDVGPDSDFFTEGYSYDRSNPTRSNGTATPRTSTRPSGTSTPTGS